ncbi:hypothetical protein H311_01751 [Anncaliia algerae PRA109]|nr:hypothetical protein H311_01751 [Anncaliia algerae PRA109]
MEVNVKKCTNYQKYILIREYSFFEGVSIALDDILNVLIKYLVNNSYLGLKKALDIIPRTLREYTKNLLICYMKLTSRLKNLVALFLLFKSIKPCYTLNVKATDADT